MRMGAEVRRTECDLTKLDYNNGFFLLLIDENQGFIFVGTVVYAIELYLPYVRVLYSKIKCT
jgi:hypothetical protein